jgi:hypothetical protein
MDTSSSLILLATISDEVCRNGTKCWHISFIIFPHATSFPVLALSSSGPLLWIRSSSIGFTL